MTFGLVARLQLSSQVQYFVDLEVQMWQAQQPQCADFVAATALCETRSAD